MRTKKGIENNKFDIENWASFIYIYRKIQMVRNKTNSKKWCVNKGKKERFGLTTANIRIERKFTLLIGFSLVVDRCNELDC